MIKCDLYNPYLLDYIPPTLGMEEMIVNLSTKDLNNFKNLLLIKRKTLIKEAQQTLGEIDETSEMVPLR